MKEAAVAEKGEKNSLFATLPEDFHSELYCRESKGIVLVLLPILTAL
jgi:hypothetical protein